MPITGDRKPVPVLVESYEQRTPQFSPDGKWFAYASNQTGRYELYVRAFEGSGGTLTVSRNGGLYPRWRADGKELFYMSADNKIMAAEIKSDGSQLSVGRTQALFNTRVPEGVSRQFYDVLPDGQHFVLIAPEPSSGTPLTLLVNWPALYRQ
jgi:Tol biopolymer transport system component